MKKLNQLTAAIALAIPVIAASNATATSHNPEHTASMTVNHLSAIDKLDTNSNVSNISGALQSEAIANIKQTYPNATIRQNQSSGIIEVMYGIGIPTNGATAEEAAFNFVSANPNLFKGLDISQLRYNPYRSKPALGGNLVRLDQAISGIKVLHGGIGLIIDNNNRVKAVMADYAPFIDVNMTSVLNGSAAVAAAELDLAKDRKHIPAEMLDVLQPGFDALSKSLGVFATPHPEQVIVKSNGQHKLAWQFYYYSTNPFGVFKYVIDAETSEVLSRKDQVKTIAPVTDESPLPQTADYFPTFPPITEGLKTECKIEDANGNEIEEPMGMERIGLRKFYDSNRVTGVEGLLTGKHALIENLLPTKAAFAQAAAGTYHFRENVPGVESRPNEKEHITPTPSSHLDGISQFIHITNLMEYLDYMHKEGDAVHSRGVGEGSFPNEYPNESVPLVGLVHMPNIFVALEEDPVDVVSSMPPSELPRYLLGMDNAFAVPLSQEINGEEVVVNPTAYGHGNLLNNLALDFSVPIHEGTHATITPIAGFEGSPEGGALNEGQADLWAYTIGETPDLGKYPINSCDLLREVSANGGNPDSYQYIRSGQSQIRYSQLGTRGNEFEEHRDGEIYAGAMWDLRELMTAMYPSLDFKRPDPVTGEATQDITQGKEAWERIFLGSMYVLGLTAPDTFVKSRDAVLIADSVLYPTDPLSLDAPGRHHALIERVFAAREIGANSEAPVGGRQTISTAVSEFTAQQDAPATPQNVVAQINSEDEIMVSWDEVEGAIAYQVLKRKGQSPERLFSGVPGREYYDGDTEFSGYTHVEFVIGDTHYSDTGQGFGRGPSLAIDALDYQYVIRSIMPNNSGQVGFSNLSGTAKTGLKAVNFSNKVDTRISNVMFDGGIFGFNQVLINNASETIYGPISFDIVKISDSSVTVNNADNGGAGTKTNPARFNYSGALKPRETSSARYLKFDNPNAQMFTFDAVITGYRNTPSRPASGEQDPIDTSTSANKAVIYHAIEERSGVILAGSTEQTFVDGVDYVDVKFTALPSATGVVATLSADVDAVAYPDLDFLLLDSDGNEMSSSGNLGSNEQVSGATQPGEMYTLRVNGYANGPTTYNIVIDQLVTDPADANQTDSSVQQSALQENIVRFSVDPVTNTISPLAILN